MSRSAAPEGSSEKMCDIQSKCTDVPTFLAQKIHKTSRFSFLVTSDQLCTDTLPLRLYFNSAVTLHVCHEFVVYGLCVSMYK